MTDPTPPARPSLSAKAFPDGPWKSIIRVFALVGAFLGLALIGNEVFENITCDGQVACSHIHLSTFFVGLSMFGLCLLILQRGDVALSFQQAAATGSIVRGWFRLGRSTDEPGTIVSTVVTTPTDPQPPVK